MPILLAAFFAILGASIGSFLNVAVLRTRVKKSFLLGRSHCRSCKTPLKWYDTVPVLSFLLLNGKCRACKTAFSVQYILVEVVVAVLFVIVFRVHDPTHLTEWLFFLRDLFITALLLFIFLYDFLYQEILDGPTLIPAAILFIIALFMNSLSAWSMILGVCIGAGFFLLQYIVSKGEWIGGGDIRLGVLMGVVLGWPHILTALLLAYILGAGVSILLIALKRKKLADETAFGTYLAVATYVVMLWGENILQWYVQLM